MIRWLVTFLMGAMLIVPVSAQAQTETHIKHGEFTIDYPADRTLTTEDSLNFVYLIHDNLQLTLYSPQVLTAYDLVNYNPSTLTRLIIELNTVTDGEVQTLDIDGRSAALHNYTKDNSSGLLIAIPFSDSSLGLIDAFTTSGEINDYRNQILEIAATFDVPPFPAPTLLVNDAAPWPDAVEELELSGLIPSGGELIFAESYVFAAGTNLTQPLAQTLSLTDIIMAGTLTYTPSAASVQEQCSLLAQRSSDTAQLAIGLNSEGSLVLGDGILHTGVDVSTAHRLLFITLGERLVIYLDSALVAETEITPNSGHFGIRVRGDGPGATCEVSDLWVYRVPSAEVGTCDITADNGAVNKRSGPGTGFEIAGILENNLTRSAIAQSTGADNLAWWQLDDGSWVREDVVTEQGACRALPTAED